MISNLGGTRMGKNVKNNLASENSPALSFFRLCAGSPKGVYPTAHPDFF